MGLPRMRLTVRRLMITVAAAGSLSAFAKFLFIENRPIDILMAAISAPGGHFTVYANGYSESKFRSLRVGMTARQVEDIMGPPLGRGQWQDVSGGGPTTPVAGTLEDYWAYSRAGRAPRLGNASGNYWKRAVMFRNGSVDSTLR